jgi:hypothetical protein
VLQKRGEERRGEERREGKTNNRIKNLSIQMNLLVV